jgi:hypothetical protein
LRRIPKVDPAKERIVDAAVASSEPPPPAMAPVPDDSQLSIDDGLKKGLQAVLLIIDRCLKAARTDLPDRETVQSLKDAMSILHDLKKKEAEILEQLSDEELREIASGKK